MKRFASLAAVGCLAAGGLASAASAPGVLPGVEPGLWEVSADATGRNARRGCLDDMILIATYAHAGQRCERTILVNTPRQLVVTLACGAGSFGRSDVTVTTPRSLKLATQGFRQGEPYDFTIYARRVGECPARERR
ncbi:DUF3617 domain-containing protein [Sphingomonas humi]